MPEIQAFSLFGIVLHGEVELGWQGFAFVIVAVLGVVLLFDHLARRAVRSIRKHRRLSFADRLFARKASIVERLRGLLSRARR